MRASGTTAWIRSPPQSSGKTTGERTCLRGTYLPVMVSLYAVRGDGGTVFLQRPLVVDNEYSQLNFLNSDLFD